MEGEQIMRIEMTGTLEELYVAASRVMGDDWAEFLHSSPMEDGTRIGGPDFLLFSPKYMRSIGMGESPNKGNHLIQAALKYDLWWLGFQLNLGDDIDMLLDDPDPDAD
jgi:hypothetical protein